MREFIIKIKKIKLKFMLFKKINILNHLKNIKVNGGNLAMLKIKNKFNIIINLFLYKLILKFILNRLMIMINKFIIIE